MLSRTSTREERAALTERTTSSGCRRLNPSAPIKPLSPQVLMKKQKSGKCLAMALLIAVGSVAVTCSFVSCGIFGDYNTVNTAVDPAGAEIKGEVTGVGEVEAKVSK